MFTGRAGKDIKSLEGTTEDIAHCWDYNRFPPIYVIDSWMYLELKLNVVLHGRLTTGRDF